MRQPVFALLRRFSFFSGPGSLAQALTQQESGQISVSTPTIGLRPVRSSGTAVDEPPGADRELLDRFVSRKDQDAFRQLVEKHTPLVMGVCRRYLRHRQDWEDAYQATFLVLAQRANMIQHKTSIVSWLYTVACRTSRKVAQRRPAGNQSPLVDEPLSNEDALARIQKQEVASIVMEELEQLPRKYRAPLLLCYYQGLSRGEIASELNCSEPVVKGQLSRGRQLLGKRLRARKVDAVLGLGMITVAASFGRAATPLLENTVIAGLQSAAGGQLGTACTANSIKVAKELGGMFTTSKVITAASVCVAACLVLLALALPGGNAAPPRPLLLEKAERSDEGPLPKLPPQTNLQVVQFVGAAGQPRDRGERERDSDEDGGAAFAPLPLGMNDADDARAMLGKPPGAQPRKAKPIPLAVGQTITLRMISRYANGRPAHQLGKFDQRALRSVGKPVMAKVTEGPYKGNEETTYSFAALRPGATQIVTHFGPNKRATTFSFEVFTKGDLTARMRRDKQGVSGLVVALSGNQQPRIGIGRPAARRPISVPVHVFRGRLKPFEKPVKMHDQLVKIIQSDKAGKFKIELPPGVYSIVPVIDGKLNTRRGEMDSRTGKMLWPSLRVFPGQFTPLTIEDTSKAVF